MCLDRYVKIVGDIQRNYRLVGDIPRVGDKIELTTVNGLPLPYIVDEVMFQYHEEEYTPGHQTYHKGIVLRNVRIKVSIPREGRRLTD